MEIAQDVARKVIESYSEHGDELPKELLIPQISEYLMANIVRPISEI